jgi:hypothetical protein
MSFDEVRDELGTFRMIPDWVIGSGVGASAIHLYLILKQYAQNKGECFPSRATLADRTNLTVRQIANLLKELQNAGCITIETRSENGRSMTNLYRLPIHRGKGENNCRGERDFPGGVKYISKEGGNILPTKEKALKEKTIKEENSRNSLPREENREEELLSEFVSTVKEIYPSGCNNPEWSKFKSNARTLLSSKPLREKYLMAVRGYVSTEPTYGYVKKPTSLIEVMDDYVDLGREPEPRQIVELEVIDTWGDL